MVQWLRCCAFIARNTDLILGQGAKILYAKWHGHKIEEKKEKCVPAKGAKKPEIKGPTH